MTSTNTRAAIYCRISSDRSGEAAGVERQEADCRQLAAKHGYDIVGVFVDNDVSASTKSRKARPEYTKMLALAEGGGLDVILAYSNSRLTRRPREFEGLVDLHERRGVIIRTAVSGDYDLATADGRLHARLLASIDAAEAERTAERVKRAKAATAAAGGYRGGGRPYGFEADGVTIREDEAEHLRWATTELVGGTSMRAIARGLNARGSRTVTGAEHQPETVRKLLGRPRNAALIGTVGNIIGPAAWPAIIARDEFDAASAILRDPRRRTQRGTARRWQGSGVYWCGTTDKVVTVSGGSSGGLIYRVNPPLPGCAVAPTLEMDEFISEVICARLRRPDARALLAAPEVDVRALSARREGLDARLREASTLFSSGAITGGQLADITADLRSQIDTLDEELSVATGDPALDAVVNAEDARAEWDALDVDTRARLIKSLASVSTSSGFDRQFWHGAPDSEPHAELALCVTHWHGPERSDTFIHVSNELTPSDTVRLRLSGEYESLRATRPG